MHAWSPQNMKELLCNTRLSNVHIFCKRALFKYLVIEKGKKKPIPFRKRERERRQKNHVKAAKKGKWMCLYIKQSSAVTHWKHKALKFKWAHTKGLTMGHTFQQHRKHSLINPAQYEAGSLPIWKKKPREITSLDSLTADILNWKNQVPRIIRPGFSLPDRWQSKKQQRPHTSHKSQLLLNASPHNSNSQTE